MEPVPAADVGQAAQETFAQGLFCAESVVLAVAQARGLESPLLPRIATAFCSGISRTGGPCGALTGAIMATSVVFGRDSADESAAPAYQAGQQLVQAFEQEFGARNCNELLGCDLATAEGQARFRQDKLHERCTRYTGRAAEMAATLIAAHPADRS